MIPSSADFQTGESVWLLRKANYTHPSGRAATN